MMRCAVFMFIAVTLLPAMAGVGYRWRADMFDEIQRPDIPEADSMGGMAWVSNNTYWTVTDEKHRPVVWELELPVNETTGKVSGCQMKMLCRPDGPIDVEGIAIDPLNGSIWLADERVCEISNHDPVTGKRLPGIVELPPEMKRFQKDSGIESLAIGRDGLVMWTCTEEAVKPDGPRSTRSHGTDVRLTRLVRASAAEPWKASGQWMYRTDPIAGKQWFDSSGKDMSRSGISELHLLDDGTLLVLEREFSVVMIPRFRCRIYEADINDRNARQDGQATAIVGKRLLFETTGFAMYEGMCQGPRLVDGSRLLMLVSDGDKKAFRSVLALRLTPL